LKPPLSREIYLGVTSNARPSLLEPINASAHSGRIVFKHLSIYLTDLPETPVHALPPGITRIAVSPNTAIFIDNTTGKLLDRSAMKALNLDVKSETLRSKIARKSKDIVNHDAPQSYSSNYFGPKSNAMGGVAHSYGGYNIIGDFHQSTPSAAYSYADFGMTTNVDSNFMRDFKCCGQTLPNLSDLLQHYEEAHAPQTPQSMPAASSAAALTFGEEDLFQYYEEVPAQQTLQSMPTASSAAALTLGKEHKPFRCPVIGCEKAYKNQNGLKYVPQRLVGQH
jgi:hypothetical protein